jgi:hypothetical protein
MNKKLPDTEKIEAGRSVASLMVQFRNDEAMTGERYGNICTLLWNIVVAMREGRDYLQEKDIAIPNYAAYND